MIRTRKTPPLIPGCAAGLVLLALLPSAAPALDPPTAEELNLPGGRYDVSPLHDAGLSGVVALGGYLVDIDAATGAVTILEEIAPPSPDALLATDREPDWDSLGAGVDGFIFDMVVYGGTLVAAGNFLQAGGAPAAHVASWDGTAWSPLGAGTDGTILGLGVWNGQLVATGLFSNAGGVPAARVAAWDGSVWSALGTGLTGLVPTVGLSVGTYDGDLVVSGQFDAAGGVPAKNIASWDGATWGALGAGLDDIGNAMTEYDGGLVVGGGFTKAGGAPVARVAFWNGASWAPIGGGVNGKVWDVDVYDGDLIAAGQFTAAGGVPAKRIASWDGATWSALAGGLNNVVFTLAVYDTALIAGGSFGEADGKMIERVATWDGAAWDSLGLGLNSSPFALISMDTTLFAAGTFTQADGEPANFIAQWRCQLPVAPGGIAATTTLCDRITVTWNDVPVETGYEIWRDGALEGTVGANVTSYDDFAVPTGTASYEVRAVNVCGSSPPAGPVAGERHELPPPPGTVTATDALCSMIRVDWSASNYADSYSVYRNGGLIATLPAPTLFYEDTPPPGTYTYAVAAGNICGLSGSTADSGKRLPGAPSAPATVTASDDKCNVVRVDWSAAADATSYDIYRGTDLVATVPAPILHKEIASPPGDHLFGVAAKNSCGRSDSTTATGKTLPPPPPPPGTFTASDTSCSLVRLDWSAVPGILNYRVYRDGALIATPAPGTLSYQDVPPPGTYAYAVAAENSCGWNGSTGAAGARLAVPGAPAALTASDTSCSLVRVDWSVPPLADSLHLYRDAAPVATYPASVTFHEEILPPGSYTYSLSAFNRCGESATAEDDGTVLPPAPSAPASLAAGENSCSRVRLEWPAAAGATKYRIYRDAALLAEVGGGTLVYDDHPAPGTYGYGVSAANSCGESIRAEDAGTMLDALPGPVSSVTASDTSCAVVRIDWTASPLAAFYRITRDAVEIAMVDASALHYEDAPVPGLHQYGVSAGSDCGYAPARFANGTRLPGRPDKPASLAAVESTCGSARLDWSAAADAGEYHVYRDGAEVAVTGALHYEETAPSGDHTYAVTAANECGESDPREKLVHLSDVVAAPAAVTASDSSCRVVRIDWDEVTGADSYRVARDDALVATLPAPASHYSDPSTVGAHTYGVEAGNACGWSDAAETSGTLLPGRADPPGGAWGSDSSCTAIHLRWDASSEADSYYVERDGSIVAALPAAALAYADGDATGDHRYKVGAANGCGVAWSAPFDGALLAVPAAPIQLTASDTSCAAVRLDWVDTTAAPAYRVKRDGAVIAVLDSGATTYADSADPGSFDYAVEGGNKCGWSAPAVDAGSRLPGRPGAPAGLTASRSLCGVVELRWDEVGDAETYRVFRDGDPITALAAGSTAYNDGNATGEHLYSVQAVNECGASPAAAATGAVSPASPAALSSFTVIDTLCDAVRFEWGASDRADTVHITRDGDPVAAMPLGEHTYEMEETAGEHTYAAYTSNRCGASAALEGAALVEGRPGSTLFTTSTGSCLAISVDWSGSPGVEEYELYRENELLAVIPNDRDQFHYVDRDAWPPGHYEYQLHGVNRCGRRFETSVGSLAPGRAGAPAGLAASDTSCSVVRLQWETAENADSFRVYREGDTIATLPADQLEYTDRWSTGNYEYAVASRSECGWSDSSVVTGTILPGTPAMPAGFAVTADRCDSVIGTWAQDEQYLLGYTLYRDGEEIATLGAGERHFADAPGPGEREYMLVGRGECAASPPAIAAGAVADTAARPALVAPRDGLDLHRDDPAALAWTMQPGATAYRVQLATDREFGHVLMDTLLSGSAAGAEIGAVESNLDYPTYWRVAAVFACADNRFSPVRSFTHRAEPLETSFALSRRDVLFDHDPLNEIAGGEVPDPEPSPIVLANTGNASFEWRCTATEEWVVVDPDHALLEPGGEDTVWVAAKPGALGGGDYTARVVVETDEEGGPADTIGVELSVRRYRQGDVDGNDRLDVVDLGALIEHVVETTPLRVAVLRAGLADVNGDGDIDVGDLVGLAREITRESLGRSASPAAAKSDDRILLSIDEGGGAGAATLALSGGVPLRAMLLHFRTDLEFGRWSAFPASGAWQIVRRQSGDEMVLLLYTLDREPPASGDVAGTGVAVIDWEGAAGRPFAFTGGSASALGRLYTVSAAGGEETNDLPAGLYLARTMPTPFRDGTVVEFHLPAGGSVTLSVFSPAGRRIRALVDGSESAGLHRIEWDGRDDGGRPVPPGIYFIRLDSAGETRTRRTVLLR